MQLTYVLATLSEAKARELIIRPADKLGYRYQDEAIQRILERAEGQPYVIQNLCYRAVEAMLDQQRSTIILADVETAMTQLEKEKSAQDPGSVAYQPRQQAEAALSIAEKPIPYHPGEEDEPS
jgi:Holliday junction resolvasome RuvABC ATP-dependent DNA helicase subunit